MTKIAVFASGKGINSHNIISYFDTIPDVDIAVLVSNNPTSGIFAIAQEQGLPAWLIPPDDFPDHHALLNRLKEEGIDWIVMAGYLKKIPPSLLQAFPGRIINLHPSLLPAHGGQGLYGRRVHESVIRSGDSVSGITIHLADEEYDRGPILFQAPLTLGPEETAATLEQRIRELELLHYPRVIYETIRRHAVSAP